MEPKISLRLKEILAERGITQKTLAQMTDLRANTISDITRNKLDSVNRTHLAIIAKALEITDLNELLYIEE